MLVFDIETFRRERGVFRDRRIELNPETNYITLIGTYDGQTLDFSPVTPLGSAEKEKDAIRWVSEKFKSVQTIVGFNILKFDIPFLVYKSIKYGIDLDVSSKKIIDLFFFPAAWLDNTDGGRRFAEKYAIGKILSLNKIEKYILNKPVNPISHDRYFEMYEARQYDGIVGKLREDLFSTYEFMASQQVNETFGWIDAAKIDIARCIKTCPFRTYLSISQEHSQVFCPLVSKTVSERVRVTPADVVGRQQLPERDAQFNARCLR